MQYEPIRLETSLRVMDKSFSVKDVDESLARLRNIRPTALLKAQFNFCV